jgi:hypothetical protein
VHTQATWTLRVENPEIKKIRIAEEEEMQSYEPVE